ncbi:facilitated trehalose transporter Tret1-2 homolog isoform X2 [Schistocerca gregaria]|uniref:facilitated trehalose transporter Tret1-2 homolog isoform X2 n=1 Tax=Schistocerca gregaria TaxID=7010 RepID=UPI00211E1A48|nr:facilitated trehalose transporter Tret1-2 homolog isoform X2 [Schistocerca gregaria]
MKTFTNKRWSVADGCGVAGVFNSTAASWPNTKPITNGKMVEEGQLAEAKPATWPQLLAAIVVNLNMFASGSAIAWPAMALPQLVSAESGLRDRPLTADEASWVASLLLFSALVVIPLFAVVSAHLGRKTLGYVIITPLLASLIIQMFSVSIEALYIARVLAGVQVGGSLMLTALYVSEIASDEVRGSLGCMLPLQCNSGILFAYVIGAFLPYYTVLYVNLATAVIFIISFAFMPETPYRLATVHQYEQARKALRWLRRGISDEQVEREIGRIRSSLVADGTKEGSAGRVSLREICSRASLKGFAIVIVLAANLQFCGSYAVLNYAVMMFDEAGGSVPSEVATIVLGALQVVGTAASVVAVDRLGRRPLLFLSNGVVGTSVTVMGVYMYLKQETQTDLSSVGWLPATCLSIYVLMLAFGLNSLPYVVLSEIVAPRIRGLAAIATYTVIIGAATIMTKLYPAMSEAMGAYGSFWFFAAVCLTCAVIGWWLLPETKGRPLEDILKELNGSKDVIVSSS